MKKNFKCAAAVVFFLILSCAVITVNIYFPEKDVQEAYKALENELMTPAQETEGDEPDAKPEGKPESSIRFEFIRAAYAVEAGIADRIAEIIKKMPDVVNAYRNMGARIAETDRLRDSGIVGEGNNGMLIQRGKALQPADITVMNSENADRKTVIEGMTRAIVRINRIPQTEENLQQVRPQAIEQFAAVRRGAAKKGWWVQLPDGNWTRK